jgi:hypothetical protein
MKEKIVILIIVVIATAVVVYFYSKKTKDNFRSIPGLNVYSPSSYTPRDRSGVYNRRQKDKEIMTPKFPEKYLLDKPAWYINSFLNISVQMIQDFLLAAQFSLLAYETDVLRVSEGCISLKSKLIKTANNGSCWCFLAKMNDGVQVLAIQGTEFVTNDHNFAEIWDDLSIYPKYVTKRSGKQDNMYVHSGFYEPLLDLWSQILPHLDYGTPGDNTKIWVVGHSLGAVRAMLTAYLIPPYVQVRITNFGGPKGGNDSFWNYTLSQGNVNIERIVADADFGPSYQPLLLYQQPPGPFYWLNDGDINLVNERNYINLSFSDHSLTTSYIPKIKALLNK